MTSLWFLAVCLACEIERSPRIVWPAAIALGAAGLTKVNAGAIPIVIVPYLAWRLRRKAIRPVVILGVVSLAMLFAFWPPLWVAPWQFLSEYFADKVGRHSAATHFLGTTFDKSNLPWYYPLFMTAATVPTVFLIAAGCGAVRGLRRARPVVVLLVANAALMLGLACSPLAPKYDGVRLFLPAMPFIGCLAGIGLSWFTVWLRRRLRGRRQLSWLVLAAIFALPVGEMAHLHPHYISYFSEAVGWLPGAHALGLEPTYWGDTITTPTLDYLNRHAPPKSRVAFVPVGTHLPRVRRQSLKDMRADFAIVDHRLGTWDYLVLVPRYGLFDADTWRVHRQSRPVFEVRRWGVTLCAVYRRVGGDGHRQPRADQGDRP